MGEHARTLNEARAHREPRQHTDPSVRRLYMRYAGQVSDTDFRYSLREEATRLGLTGWVSPVTTRVVELCVQGDEQALAEYSQKIESAGVRQGRAYDLAGVQEMSPVTDEEGFAVTLGA